MQQVAEVLEEVQKQTRRRYQEQEGHFEEMIQSTLRLIERVEVNEELGSLLSAGGCSMERLAEGRCFCDLLRRSVNQRHNRLQQCTDLRSKVDQLAEEIQKEFSDFRVIARALFRKTSDRSNLGVSGRRSRDYKRLLSKYETAVDQAKNPPYFEVLSRHGYDEERLAVMHGAAAAFRQLDSERQLAEIQAEEEARIRDEAAKEVEQWLARFRSISRRDLRGMPEYQDLLDM